MTTMREVIEVVDLATVGKQVVVATGVGTHQSLVARHFTFDHPRRRFLTSAGHGTMGSGLPYLIGAALELPDHMPILFTGDGSFAIEVAGLATALRLNLPLKVFVLDNKEFGIVHQFEMLQGLRHVATPAAMMTDWLRVVDGFGFPAICLYEVNWHRQVERMLALPGPWVGVADVTDVGVWPILEGGHRQDGMTEGGDAR